MVSIDFGRRVFNVFVSSNYTTPMIFPSRPTLTRAQCFLGGNSVFSRYPKCDHTLRLGGLFQLYHTPIWRTFPNRFMYTDRTGQSKPEQLTPPSSITASLANFLQLGGTQILATRTTQPYIMRGPTPIQFSRATFQSTPQDHQISKSSIHTDASSANPLYLYLFLCYWRRWACFQLDGPCFLGCGSSCSKGWSCWWYVRLLIWASGAVLNFFCSHQPTDANGTARGIDHPSNQVALILLNSGK